MKSALILAVILLASAPLAYAQKVTVKFDKAAPFANYKTYKFESEGGARNPIVSKMIVAAVEREFTAKGLTKVDANPDLRVSFLAASGMNLQVGEVNFGYNVNPTYEGLVPTAGTATWDVTTGTLLIDLFDSKRTGSCSGEPPRTCWSERQRRYGGRCEDGFEAGKQGNREDFQEISEERLAHEVFHARAERLRKGTK